MEQNNRFTSAKNWNVTTMSNKPQFSESLKGFWRHVESNLIFKLNRAVAELTSFRMVNRMVEL